MKQTLDTALAFIEKYCTSRQPGMNPTDTGHENYFLFNVNLYNESQLIADETYAQYMDVQSWIQSESDRIDEVTGKPVERENMINWVIVGTGEEILISYYETFEEVAPVWSHIERTGTFLSEDDI